MWIGQRANAGLTRPCYLLSPQVAEKLAEIKRKHDLAFLVAADRDNRLGRRFGILYSYDEASRRSSLESGAPIGEVAGTGAWELPMPSVIVLDRSGTVRFADVSPDWLVRTEPENHPRRPRHSPRRSGLHTIKKGHILSHDHDHHHHSEQPASIDWREHGVKVIPGNSLDPNTAQTPE